MKLEAPFGRKTLLDPASRSSLAVNDNPRNEKRQIRRQLEELKGQILGIAEHQMDVTISVLRSWISENPKK